VEVRGATSLYGHGVAALFSGPSGTGKMMAAIGLARGPGIELPRLDLSARDVKTIETHCADYANPRA